MTPLLNRHRQFHSWLNLKSSLDKVQMGVVTPDQLRVPNQVPPPPPSTQLDPMEPSSVSLLPLPPPPPPPPVPVGPEDTAGGNEPHGWSDKETVERKTGAGGEVSPSPLPLPPPPRRRNSASPAPAPACRGSRASELGYGRRDDVAGGGRSAIEGCP
ncbi:unnamed protein product, partial [Discosporangium mesarthrocarpum]